MTELVRQFAQLSTANLQLKILVESLLRTKSGLTASTDESRTWLQDGHERCDKYFDKQVKEWVKHYAPDDHVIRIWVRRVADKRPGSLSEQRVPSSPV